MTRIRFDGYDLSRLAAAPRCSECRPERDEEAFGEVVKELRYRIELC
jgi:hypothetical protein